MMRYISFKSHFSCLLQLQNLSTQIQNKSNIFCQTLLNTFLSFWFFLNLQIQQTQNSPNGQQFGTK